MKHAQMKAREHRGFVVTRSEWDSRTRRFFSFSQFWKEGKKKKKTFWSQFHCSRNNYMTMHSKNSIILAGYFDWEVWHWQRPPPTELLMPRSCVDKQSPGATSPARVSSSFSLIRHCWRLCSACFHPLINTARSTSIIYIKCSRCTKQKHLKRIEIKLGDLMP